MSFSIRPFADDYAGILPLINLINDEQRTLEQLRAAHEGFPADGMRQRLVALAEDGRIVGYANAAWWPDSPAGIFYFSLVTAPDVRRQGIGRALFGELDVWGEQQGATEFRTSVVDGDEESLRFGLNHSFPITRHSLISRLDVAAFDEERLAGVVEKALGGMRVFSYAEQPDDDFRHKMYAFYKETDLDSPGYIGTDPADYPPFERWVEEIFGANLDKVLPTAVIVAADGERWVGTTILQYQADGGLYNEYTGVLRGYRGRGIALALKLLNTRAAKAHGAPYISTRNDASNAPMLAVNKRLGYVKVSGRYWLAKNF